MKKHTKKLNDDRLDRLRNEFVKALASQPPKVQVATAVMLLMQVLNRVGGSEEAMTEMMELTKLMETIEGFHMPSTREH